LCRENKISTHSKTAGGLSNKINRISVIKEGNGSKGPNLDFVGYDDYDDDKLYVNFISQINIYKDMIITDLHIVVLNSVRQIG
jgi:hypothetical protein